MPDLAVGLMATLLVCASWAAMSCGPGPPEAVEVPSIVGLGRSDAEKRLHEQGLRWRYAGDTKVRSEPIPAGVPPPLLPPGQAVVGTPYVLPSPEVLEQDPPPSRRAAPGNVVVLTVKGGTARLLRNLAESKRRIERMDRESGGIRIGGTDL